MAVIELSGLAEGVGSASATLSARQAMSGISKGKATVGIGSSMRVYRDVAGILGENFYVNEEGVLVPIDVSTLQDNQILTWNATAKKWQARNPSIVGNIPAGGLTGQVLTKESNTDYDADWEDSTGGGSGAVGGGWAGKGADAVPAAPNAADDEFDGVGIDTAGTRRAGATAWTAQNLGTSVVALDRSCLVVAGQIAAGSHLRGYEQPLPVGNWKYRTRHALEAAASEWGAQIWVRNNANSKVESFGLVRLSTGLTIKIYAWNSVTSFNATINTGVPVGAGDLAGGIFLTLEVEYDGTNIIYRSSYNGIRFSTLTTRAVATFLAAAPTHIGLGAEVTNNVATGPSAIFDYFRRAA